MEFAAIDVETANADMASICQIGIVLYREEELIGEWKTLVDPEDYFDAINVSIHGINESTVRGAPRLPEVAKEVCGFLDDRVSVSHTHFDRVAMKRAFDRYGLRQPRCEWLDSAIVVRRTWKEFASRGYGLRNICDFLGFSFAHHDALEDAKAAAYVLNAAIKKTGLDVAAWLRRVKQPIDPRESNSRAALQRAGSPEGRLFGEVLVFTGALKMPRREAADLAAALGCQVCSGVNKKTTVLVVGDQDVGRLAGHTKSAKHRKAEDLIEKGQPIRIVRETDFMHLADVQD